MKKLSDYLSSKNLYFAFLHIALVASVVVIGTLAKQNSDLKTPSTKVSSEPLKQGERFTLSSLMPVIEGTRIDSLSEKQLIFVFTTTCQSCQSIMPTWVKVVRSVGQSKKLSIIGICLDPLDIARSSPALKNFPFPVYIPANHELFIKENHLATVPQTIIRMPSGAVEKGWRGKMSEQDFNGMVAAISSPIN